MKKSEIVVGGKYVAKVAGRLTTVRVDLIREYDGQTRYDVTNLVTQRRTTFRSAAKFRGSVVATPKARVNHSMISSILGSEIRPIEELPFTPDNTEEGEQRLDPTTAPPATGTDTFPLEQQKIEDTESISVASSDVQTAGQTTTSTCPAPTSFFPVAALAATPTKSKHPLTDEQQAIVDTAPNEQVLVIEAGAGAGKTSTLVELSNAMPGRGQYTAFNTSLVAESKSKFDAARCQCNTIHSLAFRSEGMRYKHRLGGRRVMASEVAAMLGVQPMTVRGADDKPKVLDGGLLASQAAQAVKRFCQSADREVGIKHFGSVQGLGFADQDAIKAYMLPFAQAMWADAQDTSGRLPYAHDFYVKRWQLNDPIISADYVLLDEAQDTSPVMLDVLRQQVERGVRVIVVGDSAQQIYTWRGATNALKAFPDAKRLCLSQSFRFGAVIAEVANAVLDCLQDRSPLVMRGFDQIASRLATLANPDAVLCRTNATAVQTVLTAIKDGKRPHLVGGGDEVLKFVKAAQDLQGGRRTQHPELAAFESWGEVKAYSKEEEGADLKLMVDLVEKFGADKIAAALKNMPSEQNADLVVSTCHKSKGREWDTVKLANDFKPLSKMDDEELRLLYVASTRVKKVLDVETCAPFCGGSKEREDSTVQRERAVDLTEARRLSKLVRTDEPLTSFKGRIMVVPEADKVMEDDAIVQQARKIYDGPDKRTNGTNTWTKSKRGEWLVRGKPGQSGEVTVERKSGSKSKERLGKVVWQDAEVALYEVVR